MRQLKRSIYILPIVVIYLANSGDECKPRNSNKDKENVLTESLIWWKSQVNGCFYA